MQKRPIERRRGARGHTPRGQTKCSADVRSHSYKPFFWFRSFFFITSTQTTTKKGTDNILLSRSALLSFRIPLLFFVCLGTSATPQNECPGGGLFVPPPANISNSPHSLTSFSFALLLCLCRTVNRVGVKKKKNTK